MHNRNVHKLSKAGHSDIIFANLLGQYSIWCIYILYMKWIWGGVLKTIFCYLQCAISFPENSVPTYQIWSGTKSASTADSVGHLMFLGHFRSSGIRSYTVFTFVWHSWCRASNLSFKSVAHVSHVQWLVCRRDNPAISEIVGIIFPVAFAESGWS